MDRPTAGSKKVRRGALRRLLTDEGGQGETASYLLVAIVFVLFLGISAFLVKVRPAQVTLGSAARECVRQAAESLNQGRGMAQGAAAARAVLQARHLDPSQATVTVTPLGPWERFSRVECRVAYPVDLRRVPLISLFAPSPVLELETAYTLDVQPYKSRWEENP